MNRHQLEMRLEETRGPRRRPGTRRRMTRARWWFQQMHIAVDRARPWEPDPTSTRNNDMELLTPAGGRNQQAEPFQ